MTARIPSVHSWLTGSNSPYSRPAGTDLGLRHGVATLSHSSKNVGLPKCCSLRRVRASARVRYAHVLPAKGRPTTMKPWRTRNISYTSSTLVTNESTACSPFFSMMVKIAPLSMS